MTDDLTNGILMQLASFVVDKFNRLLELDFILANK